MKVNVEELLRKVEELEMENKTRRAEADLLQKEIDRLKSPIVHQVKQTPHTAKKPNPLKVPKKRDITEADVKVIVEGKNKGLKVKDIMKNLPELNYGQIYSVYFGYTFTSISKIPRI